MYLLQGILINTIFGTEEILPIHWTSQLGPAKSLHTTTKDATCCKGDQRFLVPLLRPGTAKQTKNSRSWRSREEGRGYPSQNTRCGLWQPWGWKRQRDQLLVPFVDNQQPDTHQSKGSGWLVLTLVPQDFAVHCPRTQDAPESPRVRTEVLLEVGILKWGWQIEGRADLWSRWV